VGNDVVNAGGFDRVLAQEVDADIHQLDGIERRATSLRIRRSVRGATLEAVLDVVHGEAASCPHRVHRGGVPGDGQVEIVENAVASHEHLAVAGLFGGAAVIANGSGCSGGNEPGLDHAGRRKCRRAEQVVSTAVPRAVGNDGRLRIDAFLGEPGQRIVLTEESDDGTAFALGEFRHEGSRQTTDIAGDRETVGGEVIRMEFAGLELLERGFGVLPNRVCYLDEPALSLLQPFDDFGVRIRGGCGCHCWLVSVLAIESGRRHHHTTFALSPNRSRFAMCCSTVLQPLWLLDENKIVIPSMSVQTGEMGYRCSET
jgi:hypothetical protein